MKIATFNVNGISARLPNLLRWLAETSPDAACLQELKIPRDKFPEAAIRDAGYGVIRERCGERTHPYRGAERVDGVVQCAKFRSECRKLRLLGGESVLLIIQLTKGEGGDRDRAVNNLLKIA